MYILIDTGAGAGIAVVHWVRDGGGASGRAARAASHGDGSFQEGGGTGGTTFSVAAHRQAAES